MPAFLTAAMRQQLKLQRVPYDLVDEERAEGGVRSESYIMLRRDPAGDGWGPPSSRLRRGNAVLLMERQIGMQLIVHAQSTDPNAATVDHEDEADRIVEQLARALYIVLKVTLPATLGVASTAPRMGQSRFLTKQELEELNLMTWPGRIYVMPFQIDKGIYDTDWAGAFPPSVTIGPDGVPIDTTFEIGEQPGPPKGQPGADTEIEEH